MGNKWLIKVSKEKDCLLMYLMYFLMYRAHFICKAHIPENRITKGFCKIQDTKEFILEKRPSVSFLVSARHPGILSCCGWSCSSPRSELVPTSFANSANNGFSPGVGLSRTLQLKRIKSLKHGGVLVSLAFQRSCSGSALSVSYLLCAAPSCLPHAPEAELPVTGWKCVGQCCVSCVKNVAFFLLVLNPTFLTH